MCVGSLKIFQEYLLHASPKLFFLACCLYWYFASNCNPWTVKALHKPFAKGLLSSEEGAAWLSARHGLKTYLCSILLFCRITSLALTPLPSIHPALLAALLRACSRFLRLSKSFTWSLQLEQHVRDDACTEGLGWGLGFHQNTAAQRACWKRTDSQREGLFKQMVTFIFKISFAVGFK